MSFKCVDIEIFDHCRNTLDQYRHKKLKNKNIKLRIELEKALDYTKDHRNLSISMGHQFYNRIITVISKAYNIPTDKIGCVTFKFYYKSDFHFGYYISHSSAF